MTQLRNPSPQRFKIRLSCRIPPSKGMSLAVRCLSPVRGDVRSERWGRTRNPSSVRRVPRHSPPCLQWHLRPFSEAECPILLSQGAGGRGSSRRRRCGPRGEGVHSWLDACFAHPARGLVPAPLRGRDSEHGRDDKSREYSSEPASAAAVNAVTQEETRFVGSSAPPRLAACPAPRPRGRHCPGRRVRNEGGDGGVGGLVRT